MSKELENLLEDLDSCEEVKTRYGLCYAYSPDVVEELRQALLELEAIKEAKPSEALKCLEKPLIRFARTSEDIDFKDYEEFDTIKQALLKAQELEKENAEYKRVLEIIFNKECDMRWLKYCIKENRTVEEYNDGLPEYYEKLTQEEFDLLKRYFGNE